MRRTTTNCFFKTEQKNGTENQNSTHDEEEWTIWLVKENAHGWRYRCTVLCLCTMHTLALGYLVLISEK